MAEYFMGLTAEMYRAITTIVDDRVKEIRVTREYFDDLKGIVRELAQAQVRTEKELRNLAYQVGRLSDTVGYGLEDLGQWILPAYLEKAYGITGIKRCTRKFVAVDSQKAEIDLYARGKRNGETVVVLGESKNRIGKTEVKNFVKRLRFLEKVFKETKFPLLFGYWAHPDAEQLAKDRGIEVICSYQLTREG